MRRFFRLISICIISTFLLSMHTSLTADDNVGGNITSKYELIEIINLGPIINTEYNDFAPTISADGKTLFFVSNRTGSIIGNVGKNSEDFWSAEKEFRRDSVFYSPINIDYSTESDYFNVNSIENDGPASIAADKQSIYLALTERPDGLGVTDIYAATLNGKKWSKPYNLGKNVNTEYYESHPSIAPDKTRLYFTSSRPGPHSNGKTQSKNLDIWYCDWDDDMEEWLPAKNLKAINTKGCEWSPFIAADGLTLFYASNKTKPNVGGLDFYMTTLNPSTDTWSKPELLPEPINTKEDETFISLPASGDVLYFSSKREDIPRFQGKYDIFMAFVPTFFRAVNVTGTVVDECSREYIPAEITLTNLTTNKVTVDSVTVSKTEFSYTVTNADYGNPDDSLKFVDFKIVAKNDKYGQTDIIQTIEKPSMTDDPNRKGEVTSEIKIELELGEVPTLVAEVDLGSYLKKINPGIKERPLVMEETITWAIFPLLNYVFFDIGQSDIHKRYKTFNDKSKTTMFTDTTIAGGTLDKYYHVLNIYGFRLNKYPEVKIDIVGCTDADNDAEKVAGLSKTRAENVRNYLRDIWNISESRMKVIARKKPKAPSGYQQDPVLGKAENRRVEINITGGKAWKGNNWEVIKPVFEKGSQIEPQPSMMNWVVKNGIEDKIIKDRRIEIKRGDNMWKVLGTDEIGLKDGKFEWDWTNDDFAYPEDEVGYTAQFIVTSTKGNECKSNIVEIPVMQITSERKKVETGSDSTYESYNLILFPFNSADAGPLNARIMKDYVYSRCKESSRIVVVGHTDVKGLEKSNQRLSERRAASVRTGIQRKTKGNYGKLDSDGVGENNALFTNELPEGRFYNRTVHVLIRTPVQHAD